MYAVIKAGSRQFKVAKGDKVILNNLASNVGDKIDFEEVLMIGDEENVVLGQPYVPGAKVEGVIKRKYKGEKVIVFKYKRKKNYKRMKGHRQDCTEVEISGILT